jgi:O-acetyl-ADP-ribose deacetylase (regulator of RNase III)
MLEVSGSSRVTIVEGDITALAVDAIVNPANSALQLGAGVAGAIRSMGGPSIQRECDAIGHCPVGGAVVTGAGDLKARYVIHAVGPLGSDPDADRSLASACRSALERAAERTLDSIAIPAISTGVFGFPLARAAEILTRTAVEFAKSHEKPEKIVFCLWGREAYDAFQKVLDSHTR